MAKDSVDTAWYDFIGIGGGVIKRGNKFLERISMTNEIDTVPTMTLTIPLSEMPTEENWNVIQVKVYLGNKYIFWGIIDSFDIDYAEYSVSLSLSHIVAEHRNRFMPVNLIVKSMPMKNLYNHMDFNMTGWEYEFSEKAAGTLIEYTFSAETKLAAIDEVISQTEDIHWRVKLNLEKVLQFSEFGDLDETVISQARNFPDECTNTQNLLQYPTMLTEPVISMDFTNHVNRIVILCGDIDKDVEHMTIRHIYENSAYQTAGFPVGMYENNVNQQDEPQYEEEESSSEDMGSTSSKSITADTSRVRTGITK